MINDNIYFQKVLERKVFGSNLYIHVLLKFAVPVIRVVVAGLVPLRGGNEFWTCCSEFFFSVNFCFSFV